MTDLTDLRRLFAGLVLAGVPFAATWAADDAAPSYALGAGMQRMPAWIGADHHRNQAVPYFDIELPGWGELSSTDGLMLDLIHDTPWHGGLYGNYQWGRTSHALGPRLKGIVDPLGPRIHGGGYLEYRFTEHTSLGGHVSHDTQGAGAYAALYADVDLPSIGYWQHSLEAQWQGMNGAAMRRFFGLRPAQAAALGVRAWQPGAGGEQVSLEYDAFMPTSRHTGFALALDYGRLIGPAGNSPLVQRFGARIQVTTSIAFLYHF